MSQKYGIKKSTQVATALKQEETDVIKYTHGMKIIFYRPTKHAYTQDVNFTFV